MQHVYCHARLIFSRPRLSLRFLLLMWWIYHVVVGNHISIHSFLFCSELKSQQTGAICFVCLLGVAINIRRRPSIACTSIQALKVYRSLGRLGSFERGVQKTRV